MLKNRCHLAEFLPSLLQAILRGSVLEEHDGPGRNADGDDRGNSHAQSADHSH
jgi:hypothetical protein